MLVLEKGSGGPRPASLASSSSALIGLVLAGLADVVAHLEAPDVTQVGAGHAHTSSEFAAHLLGFMSMVVIQSGVVVDGVRRSRTRKGVA